MYDSLAKWNVQLRKIPSLDEWIEVALYLDAVSFVDKKQQNVKIITIWRQKGEGLFFLLGGAN